jgi:RNA polymerase sigma-70 factor (ECF subfamily)
MSSPISQEKFTQIYFDNRDMMFSIAGSVLHNEYNAEEAVQEAFLTIARKMSKENNEFETKSCEEISSLCGIICRGCAIDIYRKLKSKAAHIVDMDDDIISETVPISDDIVEYIISNAGYNKILEIISEMSDIYRDVLTLKLVHQYSNNEIASTLHITKRAVEMRFFRGKGILAEHLREEAAKCNEI